MRGRVFVHGNNSLQPCSQMCDASNWPCLAAPWGLGWRWAWCYRSGRRCSAPPCASSLAGWGARRGRRSYRPPASQWGILGKKNTGEERKGQLQKSLHKNLSEKFLHTLLRRVLLRQQTFNTDNWEQKQVRRINGDVANSCFWPRGLSRHCTFAQRLGRCKEYPNRFATSFILSRPGKPPNPTFFSLLKIYFPLTAADVAKGTSQKNKYAAGLRLYLNLEPSLSAPRWVCMSYRRWPAVWSAGRSWADPAGPAGGTAAWSWEPCWGSSAASPGSPAACRRCTGWTTCPGPGGAGRERRVRCGSKETKEWITDRSQTVRLHPIGSVISGYQHRKEQIYISLHELLVIPLQICCFPSLCLPSKAVFLRKDRLWPHATWF